MVSPGKNAPQALGAGGLLALIVPAMLPHLAGTSFEELVCLSGTASSVYVWDPGLNPTEPAGGAADRAGGLFSNYGILEALGYATGWELGELNFLPRASVEALLAYELDQGRSVYSAGVFGQALDLPAEFVGYDPTPGARRFEYRHSPQGQVKTMEDSGFESLQQGQAVDQVMFSNWCVVARPGQRAPWTGSPGRLRAQVLKWTASHLQGAQEFFHETRLNYATGAAGVRALGGLEPRHQSYIEDTVGQLTWRWRVLERQLAVWGEELERWQDLSWGSAQAAAQAMERGAQALGQAAGGLERGAWEDTAGQLVRAAKSFERFVAQVKGTL